MGEPPSGTVTFLFTDIEGSSRIWEAHPEAMAEALVNHDDLLRKAVEAHDGYVVKSTGDGLFAAFPTAPGAIAAAVDGQVALGQSGSVPVGQLRVRMGLHTGEAVYRDGDYHGPALNRAARLMSAGHGGQVLISSATAALLGERLPDGAELVPLGEHRLRDLGRPEVLYQLAHPGLIREFPALRTLDSYPGNLPLQVSSFIGRDREVARALSALEESRILTLTGVGGVGKTRLALQVAAAVLPRFREGAWVVELAPVRDPAGVIGAIAGAFGVAARPGMSLEESVTDFLRTKKLLLLLDNCEHLLEAVAEVVDSLERSCGGLVVLATSREGLALDGERVLPVPSLSSPPADADPEIAAKADAVRLFLERARATDPDFSLGPNNSSAVVAVCKRLDGVPLAIELAAARVMTMSLAELLAGLDRRFTTLAGGRRRAVQRHQTLRAAIDWSYELLSEPERRLLERLAIFSGGCTRAAAEVVCGSEPLAPKQVFELLAALVTKSLLVAERDAPETRYRLLETIREYGEERVAEREETDALRTAHAEYYCDLIHALHDDLEGPREVEAIRRLDVESDNLRAALNHAIDTGNVDLALRITASFPAGNLRMGYHLILPTDAVLALPDVSDHPLYPYALALFAYDAAAAGELTGIEELCQKAIAEAARFGPDPGHWVDQVVAGTRATAAIAAGRWADSAIENERGAEIGRLAGRPAMVAAGLMGASTGRLMAGDPKEAEALATEGLEMARAAGSPVQIAMNLMALAGAIVDHDPQRARILLDESLKLHRELDFEGSNSTAHTALIAARTRDWHLTLDVCERAIRFLHWSGERAFLSGILNLVARAVTDPDFEPAAVLQGTARRLAVAAASTRRPGGVQAGPATASFVTEIRRECSELIRERLGDQRLADLRAEGEAMDEDQAVALALEIIDRRRSTESSSAH
jgi:predicted ATPase/class 3 adenylate cyclase